MVIEYIDPDQMEKAPEAGDPASDGPATDPTPVRQAGRLGDVDSKFAEALTDLEKQIARLSGINAGLFGSDPAQPVGEKEAVIAPEAGVVLSLEARVAELRRLVSRLEKSVEETASLT